MYHNGSLKRHVRYKLTSSALVLCEKLLSNLNRHSNKCLLHFVTTYLCETVFCGVDVMKAKCRSSLITEKEVQVVISSMTPRVGKPCAKYQNHLLH